MEAGARRSEFLYYTPSTCALEGGLPKQHGAREGSWAAWYGALAGNGRAWGTMLVSCSVVALRAGALHACSAA